MNTHKLLQLAKDAPVGIVRIPSQRWTGVISGAAALRHQIAASPSLVAIFRLPPVTSFAVVPILGTELMRYNTEQYTTVIHFLYGTSYSTNGVLFLFHEFYFQHSSVVQSNLVRHVRLLV